MEDNPIIMRDSKIGIIVRDGLEVWQKLNVTAFLVAGIAAASPEIIGEQIVGLALRADRKNFDKIVNGLKLHS